MFRVPEDTVLRRAAATTLLVLASASLTACGSDSSGSASAGATPAASSPAATTVGTSPIVVDKSIKAAGSTEGPKEIKAASTTKISAKKNNARAEKAAAAAKAAGFKDAKVVSSGDTLTTLFVDGMSVAFFQTEKDAAQSAYQYVQMIESRPGFGHIARTDNRVYILSNGKGVTKEQVASFDKLRSAIDAAL